MYLWIEKLKVFITLNSNQLHIRILLIQSKIAMIAATVMEPKRADRPAVLLHVPIYGGKNSLYPQDCIMQ